MNVKSNKVISFGELVTFIIGVVIVFVIFFPKNSLERYVLSENKNYTLAVLYLKGLIKANPDNPDFILYLIKFETKAGRLNEASRLIEKYSNNSFYINNLIFLQNAYMLNKYLYFKTKKRKYVLYAKKYLLYMLMKFNKYFLVYQEAKNLQLYELEYISLKYLVKSNPKLIIKLIKLAEITKKYNELPALYEKEYKYTGDIKWLIREANLLLYIKKDYRGYKLFLKAFNKSDDFNYFKKAVNILLFYKKDKEAFKILKKYEKFFLKKKNIEALKFILKIYIAYSKIEDAKSLSKKILRSYL